VFVRLCYFVLEFHLSLFIPSPTLLLPYNYYYQYCFAQVSDHYRVMQLTEEMISGSSASRTSALVTALVQFIIRYACYFCPFALLPFCPLGDALP
jgi:hypothetical protein